jgi:hypothetical protein
LNQNCLRNIGKKKIVFLIDEYEDFINDLKYPWKYPESLLFKVNKLALEMFGSSNWCKQKDKNLDEYISKYQNKEYQSPVI